MSRLVVPAILVVVLLVLALAGTATATEDNWGIGIGASGESPPFGYYEIMLGVHPTALEGLDPIDGSAYNGLTVDVPGTGAHVAAVVPGQSDLYGKCAKSKTIPAPEKTWDFFLAANVNWQDDAIRLRAYTTASFLLPPATAQGIPVRYLIRLRDSKGVYGAPCTSTQWEIPIPTSHSSLPFWTCPVDFPRIRVSYRSNSALIAEGYRLQLVQEIVPEPASILTLGGGVLGLIGFARRRRR